MCITLNPHVPLMTRGLLVTAQIIPNVRTHGSCSISQDPLHAPRGVPDPARQTGSETSTC